jgi:multidrug efflux pump subunit AcrA (membrane-fusion protein)
MKMIGSLRTMPGSHAASALSLVALLAACASPPPPKVEVVRPVKTMVVDAGDEARSRSFPGTVEASRRVELAFRVPGVVVALPVREGQEVKAGEVIGELRKDEFQARLDALRGQLDQARSGLDALRRGERGEELARRESQVRAARARLSNARAQYNRFRTLLRESAVSRVEFEATETEYRVAREEYEAAKRTLEIGTVGRVEDIEAAEASVRGLEGRVVEANLQLEDATLRAPFDGVIAQRFVEQGQTVQAKQPVVRFQDVDEVDIGADVPETVMASDIRRADLVSLVAELSGAPGLRFPVELREIAQVGDPVTQTFRVTVSMRRPDGIRMLPGMTATVTATFRRAAILGERILVPVTSVAQQDGQASVWLVDGDEKVVRRPVTLGGVTGGRVEVLDGLEPGERIVIAGVHSLRDGMQIRDLGDALGGGES